MKKLNLTNTERNGVTVTFAVNKFEAYLPSGALLGKDALKKELADNQIKNAKFDVISQRKYLANYGATYSPAFGINGGLVRNAKAREIDANEI